MKKRIWVRPAKQADAKFFQHYMVSTEDNLFDPEVMTYPSTALLVAHKEGEPLVFLPVQQAIVLESIGKKPGITDFEMAVSLKEIISAVVMSASATGKGELYFLCKEPSTQAFAEKNGFEKLPWPIYRLKLSSLEHPDEDIQAAGNQPKE